MSEPIEALRVTLGNENEKRSLPLQMHFLVACYATLHPAMSVSWLVGPSVGWSVRPLFTFLAFLSFLSIRACPDALVTFSSTGPAHSHATRAAVYPALLFFNLVYKTSSLDTAQELIML